MKEGMCPKPNCYGKLIDVKTGIGVMVKCEKCGKFYGYRRESVVKK